MRHEIVAANTDIEARFYLSVDDGSFVTPHWHNRLEMVYMLEDSMEVSWENRRTQVHPGDVALVNSRVIHSVRSSQNKALVLQVPEEVLKKFVPEIWRYSFFVPVHPESRAEQAVLEKMKGIFLEMQQIYENRPEGYLLKFNSLLYDLLYELLQSCSEKLGERQISQNNRHLAEITAIMQEIKDRYKEQVPISSLAEQWGYHPDYLARIFRRYTGMTITEYVYAVRIQHVYRDLADTENSIGEIFAAHGCQNYRVAMRVFKEKYGCTPKEKRQERKSRNRPINE